MSHWYNKLDVPCTFPSDFLFSYFNATAVANDPFITDAFVFSTVTFPVFNRAEYPLTE